MFVKRNAYAFSALNLVLGLATAQSIFDKAPKTGDKPESTKPAAAAALATLSKAAPETAAAPAPAATAPTPTPAKPAPLTIKDLAAKQADALAADASKRMLPAAPTAPAAPVAAPVQAQVIGELTPVSPIPVSMANPPKPLKPIAEKKAPPPPPPRPYFAALVGFKGKEIAEIHIGPQINAMKTGDSINEWKITGVVDGRLMLTGTSSKTVKGKTVSVTKDRVLSVGEFL